MIMTMKKLTGIMIAAKIPNARIGLMSESALAKNAIAVVLEVTRIARNDLLKLYDMRLARSSAMIAIWPDCLHASQKTKISSAAMPSTIKIVS